MYPIFSPFLNHLARDLEKMEGDMRKLEADNAMELFVVKCSG